MKYLYALSFVIFTLAIFSLPAFALTDVYYAASSAGANNGTSCANAYAYNDGTNGWDVSGNQGSGKLIAPGTTVHLCGTITIAANTAGLIVLASGTSGSPITIKFETNAILQSPQFNGGVDGPSGGSYSPGGGIQNSGGYQYIIVDGGSNGIIQNTANGAGLTYDTCSVGIDMEGDYNIIRNLHILNIYQMSGSTDSAGGCTGDIYHNYTNFMQVCNNYLENAEMGAEINAGYSSTTPETVFPACSSNTFTAGYENFFANYLYDHDWMLHANGTGAPNFYSNEMTYWTLWFEPGASFHQDGFFFTGASSTTFNPQVFDNYVHGDIVGGSPTGLLYFTDTGPGCDGTGQEGAVYNNVWYGTAGSISAGSIISTQQACSADAKGPYYFWNNTFVNTQYQIQNYLSSTSPTVDFRNNVWYGQTSSTYFYLNQGANGYTFATATFQGNDYYNGRTLGPFGLFQSPAVFSTWKTNCVSGSGTGCDSASVTTDPVLSGESSFNSGGTLAITGFVPTSGSPTISLGSNLTSLCSTYVPLCYDAPLTVGPGTNGWGTARPNAAFPAGAFQYVLPSGNPGVPGGGSFFSYLGTNERRSNQ